MAVSKRLRYEILRRDSHTCRYCGASAPDVSLRVDHVTPVALGGTDEPGNLVTSCEPCNSGKSSSNPDAPLVASVSDDALRWAAAMAQAADELREQQAPKVAYREAFRTAWNGWSWERDGKKESFDLPKDWKGSLDAFREAGLPQDVWPDIVEKSMTNKTVRSENLFRYCCGIGWRMVGELQERARVLVGAMPEPTGNEGIDSRAVVRDAAFTVWLAGRTENDEPPTEQQQEKFRESLAALTDWDLTDPGRILAAAQHATYFEIDTIAEALRDKDRDQIWNAWVTAWPTVYVPGETDEPWSGRYIGGPSERERKFFKEQIDTLLGAEVYASRLIRAASHAGIHKSARVYEGLADDELAMTGVTAWRSRASELWRVAYRASVDAEPSVGEISAFFDSLNRIVADGDFRVADVFVAASTAGSYQDPDVSTCLPRCLSALEVAARPLQSAA